MKNIIFSLVILGSLTKLDFFLFVKDDTEFLFFTLCAKRQKTPTQPVWHFVLKYKHVRTVFIKDLQYCATDGVCMVRKLLCLHLNYNTQFTKLIWLHCSFSFRSISVTLLSVGIFRRSCCLPACYLQSLLMRLGLIICCSLILNKHISCCSVVCRPASCYRSQL